MSMIIEWLSYLCILAGSAFCLIGAIGLIRMPTFMTRVHAVSVLDTLGAILVLCGLMLQSGLTLITVKLVFILVFLLLTGPVATHALVNTAMHDKKISELLRGLKSNT